VFINLTPLFKYRDYRLLYLGQFVSLIGSMLTYVALPYQIFQLTHSSLAVGNVGIIQLIPLLVTSLWGGALADKYDRKKLLISAEVALSLACLILLTNSLLTQPHLWIIYVAAGLASAFNGFHRPTLEAITQVTIDDKKDMPAISSLSTFKSSFAMIIGPALGGLILAKLNVSSVYFLDFLTYLVSLVAVLRIKVRFDIKAHTESTIKSIKQGMRYAANRQELMGSYLVDFVAMIFGMPMALFPAIAASFHSVTALGWLYAAPSIGMLLTTVISGWTQKIHRHGLAIAISATIWGVAIIAFGLSQNLYVGLFFLAIAGGADAISGIFRLTLWNQTIPPAYRGRLAGIEMISYMSGPLLGNAEAGMVAAAFGTQFSVVSGGALCVVGVAILAVLLPRFLKYSSLKV
jgi:MFS family permease